MLPYLISVPHGGERIPAEVASLCRLAPGEIRADSDEGAAAIYALLEGEVEAFVTTDIARAIIDLNRPEDDLRPDGVVKTQTCFEVEVYHSFPDPDLIARLLQLYYRPYHGRLTTLASSATLLGVDCHTMLAVGPPIGPMAGEERPRICLGNVDGQSCPMSWVEKLAEIMESTFQSPVAINKPFKGGHITRSHSSEIPWLQIEMSRAPFLSEEEKGRCVLESLRRLVPFLG